MNIQVSSARRWLFVRIALALILGVFLILRVTHGLGIHSIPNPRSVTGWRDTLRLAAIAAPFLFVFVGMACSRVSEFIGWSLLLLLVFAALLS